MAALHQTYFAYGSNMDARQFAERCPASVFEGRAVLPDHRWIITNRGVASVIRSPGHTVHGVLARLTPADEKTLDRREGVASGCYRREFLEVMRGDGTRHLALVYVANDPGEGTPRPGYLERILAGAQHHGLPAAAIAEIESWKSLPPDRGA
jgi:cation transport regulator ChaC